MTRHGRPAATRAQITARQLLAEFGIASPNEIDLEAIAMAKGVFVVDRPLYGCEARLVRDRSHAVIAVNELTTELGRRRFGIAHELGHFLLHPSTDIVASCSAEAMLSWHKTRPEELEANAFAAELLMPETLFRSSCPKGEPEHSVISSLADQFRSTLTATLLRFVELGPVVCALFVSKDGIVKWFNTSHDFRFRVILPGMRLSLVSCASDQFTSQTRDVQFDDVPCQAWLDEPDLPQSWTIRELSFHLLAYGTILSLVWPAPGSPLDDYESPW